MAPTRNAGKAGNAGKPNRAAKSRNARDRPPVCAQFEGVACIVHEDAVALFSAVAIDRVVQGISDRPTAEERSNLIKSGNVIIFEENGPSGIKRWTDDRNWSPSRIDGPFILYRELNEPMPAGEQKKANRDPDGRSCSSNKPAKEAAVLPADRGQWDESVTMGSLVGNTYNFKDGGLMKKTCSMRFRGHKFVMVSYYTHHDIIEGKLLRPKEHPLYNHLRPSQDLLEHGKISYSKGDNKVFPGEIPWVQEKDDEDEVDESDVGDTDPPSRRTSTGQDAFSSLPNQPTMNNPIQQDRPGLPSASTITYPPLSDPSWNVYQSQQHHSMDPTTGAAQHAVMNTHGPGHAQLGNGMTTTQAAGFLPTTNPDAYANPQLQTPSAGQVANYRGQLQERRRQRRQKKQQMRHQAATQAGPLNMPVSSTPQILPVFLQTMPQQQQSSYSATVPPVIPQQQQAAHGQENPWSDYPTVLLGQGQLQELSPFLTVTPIQQQEARQQQQQQQQQESSPDALQQQQQQFDDAVFGLENLANYFMTGNEIEDILSGTVLDPSLALPDDHASQLDSFGQHWDSDPSDDLFLNGLLDQLQQEQPPLLPDDSDALLQLLVSDLPVDNGDARPADDSDASDNMNGEQQGSVGGNDLDSAMTGMDNDLFADAVLGELGGQQHM